MQTFSPLSAATSTAFVKIAAGSSKEISISTNEQIPDNTECEIVIEIESDAQLSLSYFENRPIKESSIVSLKIVLAQNASLNMLTVLTGSSYSSLNLTIVHSGVGSSSTQQTLFFGDHDQKFEIISQTILDAPDSTTSILAKGVLNHDAQARFDGSINISRNGNNSSGNLHEHTLLLSSSARINAIPALKIEHNNVQATHSASVTRIDDEHLFYCESRGIDEQTATHLIVDGFLGEIYRSTKLSKQIEPIILNKIAQLAL